MTKLTLRNIILTLMLIIAIIVPLSAYIFFKQKPIIGASLEIEPSIVLRNQEQNTYIYEIRKDSKLKWIIINKTDMEIIE